MCSLYSLKHSTCHVSDTSPEYTGSMCSKCYRCWSYQSDRTGGSRQSHLKTAHRWSLDMSVDYCRRRQAIWPCDWQSPNEQDVDKTTTHNGSIHQGDRDTPGCIKWRFDTYKNLCWCCMGHCRRALQTDDTMTPAGQMWLMTVMMMMNKHSIKTKNSLNVRTYRLTARQLEHSINEPRISEKLFSRLHWLPIQTLKQITCPLQVTTAVTTQVKSHKNNPL